MAHTPGPWRWSDDGEGNIWGRSGLEPCVLYGTVESLVNVYDADARLIAAAPVLLAALQNILLCDEAQDLESMANALQDARAAIAKATGAA